MWYDVGALVVVLIFAWKGANKGAIWQLATIASIGLCIFFAAQLSPAVEKRLPETLDPVVRHWASIGAVYLGLSFVTFLVARKLRLWFEKIRFVEFDRHWGAILGAAKGAIAVLCSTIAIAVAQPATQPTIRESTTGNLALNAARHSNLVLPADLADPIIRALQFQPENHSDDLNQNQFNLRDR